MDKQEILEKLGQMTPEQLSVVDNRIAVEADKAAKIAAFGEFIDKNGTDVVAAVLASVATGATELPAEAQAAIEKMARQLAVYKERAETAEKALAEAAGTDAGDKE